VVRVDTNGQLRDSKPCADCLHELKRDRRFRFCYYSNAEGQIVKVRMSDLKTNHVSMGFRHNQEFVTK
jgi:hypothetical protein